MSPIVRARLQLTLLPILPLLPKGMQTRVWWWLRPPDFAEQSRANYRRQLAEGLADIFKPDSH